MKNQVWYPAKGADEWLKGGTPMCKRWEMLVISLRLRKSRILVLFKMFKMKGHYF